MRPRPVQTKKRENHEATSAVKLRVLSPKSEAESAVEDAKVFTSSNAFDVQLVKEVKSIL